MAKKEQIPRVTGEFMQELYENQQDRIWTDDQMVMIRRNGEESERVFSSGQPYQITSTHIGISWTVKPTSLSTSVLST